MAVDNTHTARKLWCMGIQLFPKNDKQALRTLRSIIYCFAMLLCTSNNLELSVDSFAFLFISRFSGGGPQIHNLFIYVLYTGTFMYSVMHK